MPLTKAEAKLALRKHLIDTLDLVELDSDKVAIIYELREELLTLTPRRSPSTSKFVVTEINPPREKDKYR